MSSLNSYFREANKLVPDIAAIVTATTLCALVFALGKAVNAADNIKLADYISGLAMLSSAAAVSVVVWVHKKTQDFNKSEAFLRETVAIINKARGILTDINGRPTNDRVCWVTAARLITRAEIIAKKITVDAHKMLLEAEHDYQRHKFGDFLKWDGQTLTAAFFCGTQDPSESIGEAAFKGPHKDNESNWLPVRIIAVVYRFFQFPVGYDDPLENSSELTDQELNRLWMFEHRGLTDYIVFRKLFFGVRRKVFRKGTPSIPKHEATSTEITTTVAANRGLTD